MTPLEIRFLLLAATLLFFTEARDFKRVCYFTNWSHKRAHIPTQYDITDIDPSLCTHINYAFADVDEGNLTLIHTIPDDENSTANKKGRFYEFTALKKNNPSLKMLLSVGGWKTNGILSYIASSNVSMKIFARKCRSYLDQRGFDGLDVDWEFPNAQHKDGFTQLLKALYEEFKNTSYSDGKQFLLSIAAAAEKDTIDASYNVPEIVKYVDFINVMTYAYYGDWSKQTGFYSGLYSYGDQTSVAYKLSTDWTMNRYIELGAPSQMLVVGLSAVASGFELADAAKHGVGARIKHGIAPGKVINVQGIRSYQGLCLDLRNGGYTQKWYDPAKQTYAFKNTSWFGFENERSIALKVKYAYNHGFGGVMFWALDLDDFKGDHCNRGQYPLLSTIRNTTLFLTSNNNNSNNSATTRSVEYLTSKKNNSNNSATTRNVEYSTSDNNNSYNSATISSVENRVSFVFALVALFIVI